MNSIESFELDHDRVTAPYVGKAKVVPVNQRYPECVVSKFEVRFGGFHGKGISEKSEFLRRHGDG